MEKLMLKKTFRKSTFLLFFFLIPFQTFAKIENVNVDPNSSKVVWLGKKVTGEHSGEVKIQDGSLTFEGKNFTGGKFTIDMSTITNTDITDKEYNKKLVEHLKGEDFFSTENNKTANFIINSVSKIKGNEYTIVGDLTIKGKTSPVTFQATVTKNKARGTLKFDRTTYDIKYGSGKFFQNLGDKMIHDEIQLSIELTAKK